MSSVRGRVKDGKLELDGPLPPEWRDGLQLRVEPEHVEDVVPEIVLETDAQWGAFFDSIRPYQMSDEEHAEFKRVLEEQKQWELANWEARNKKIEGLFP